MTVIVNEVRSGFYLDSVALMRLSTQLAERDDIHAAVLMIGTDNNKRIMSDAGLLVDEGHAAGASDLVLALRAADRHAADAAVAAAYRSLDERSAPGSVEGRRSVSSVPAALQELPDANLALISTPGEYAAREAKNALARGLNVMIFSDNVPLDAEIALKRMAQQRGLIVMGPDCGTAYIAGQPLAFCNVVPRGNIGIVAASGTGLQEVISLIARNGSGVSHGIGVGGRDLHDAVGGISTLSALDMLGDDPRTQQVVLISKPPGPRTAERVYERLVELGKPATVCTLGLQTAALPASLRVAHTLQATVEICLGLEPVETPPPVRASNGKTRNKVHALYSGGTLCSEALAIFHRAGVAVASNLSLGSEPATDGSEPVHRFTDLGADEYTVGRPHPMIDPQVRNVHLQESLRDPAVVVILLDVVLGYGAHQDPAGALLETIATVPAESRPLIVASVCGTDADPQNRSAQVSSLAQQGVVVANSNAEAARWALRIASDD